MTPRKAIALSVFIMTTLLVGMAFFGVSGAAPSPQEEDLAAQLPEGEGKGYVQTICTSCHGLSLVVYQRKTLQGWEATTWDMLGRISAGMDREAEIISKYLAASFPAEPPAAAAATAPDGTAEADESGVAIYHQGVFRFKPEVTQAQIEEVLESGKKALAGIPQVAALIVGKVMQENSEFPYGLVVGVKSEEWGEAVTALVVLKQGADCDRETLIAFCKETLASYKAPKVIEFVTKIPRTGLGKIDRGKVAGMAGEV